MGYEQEAAAVGKAADDDIAAQQSTIADQEQTIAEQAQQITDLQQQLADCQGGGTEPSWSSANLGYCPEPNNTEEVKRLGEWSGGKVRRSYLSPKDAFPSNPPFAGDAAAGLRTAHTFKMPGGGNMKQRLDRMLSRSQDAQVLSYLGKSAPDSILGFEHEPEDDFNEGGWNRSVYRDAQKVFCSLVDEANKRDGGHRLKSLNIMSTSDQPTEIDDWYPGDGFLDIIGFDGYNWPNRTPGSSNIPNWVEFEAIFKPDRTNTLALGCEFAIFEYGCRKAHLYNDVNNSNLPTDEMSAKQVDWHHKAFALMQEWQPVCATYFHHDWWLMKKEGHLAMGGN